MTPWRPEVGDVAITVQTFYGVSPGLIIRVVRLAIDPTWCWVAPENTAEFPYWGQRASGKPGAVPVQSRKIRLATPEERARAQLTSLEGL